MTQDIPKATALKFVILMGAVSMFADMTYEGARSVTGPYLATLGANAAIVGFVAGFGEFLGYGFRFLSGYFTERSGRYWLMAFIGYIVNLLAVPLLALATNWQIASLLIIAERAGKGIRVPARDAMISHASNRMGMGWGFGLHQAMDQAGAMTGPLMVALILYHTGQYKMCFVFLLLPALASLFTLGYSSITYPNPKSLEDPSQQIKIASIRHNKAFWIYLAGASLVALGYADFALIAYHFEKIKLLSPAWIPITYAIALGVNIFMAPFLGFLYDRYGFIVQILVTLLASVFPPLVFLGDANVAIFGTILWGIGFGAQGSLMRAIVANQIGRDKRAFAYGVFNGVFGLSWFVGSALMGVLYDISIPALIVFSVTVQLLAIPMFWQAR